MSTHFCSRSSSTMEKSFSLILAVVTPTTVDSKKQHLSREYTALHHHCCPGIGYLKSFKMMGWEVGVSESVQVVWG